MIHVFDSIVRLVSGYQGPRQVPPSGINHGLSLITSESVPAGSLILELETLPKSPDPLKVPREDDTPRLMGRSPSVAPYMPNGTPDTQPHHSPPVGHEYSNGCLVFKGPPRPRHLPQFIAGPPSSTLLKPAANGASVAGASVADWLFWGDVRLMGGESSKKRKSAIVAEELVSKRPRPDDKRHRPDDGVVISTSPPPVSIGGSDSGTSTPVYIGGSGSGTSTPKLSLRCVHDLFNDHDVKFPHGVSDQIFDQLRFDKTMRQFNNIVGVQLSKTQVRALFEALNQLDSVIQSEGDRGVIQDAKYTLVEYVSRCVCDEVSKNPFNVASIPACLDEYLPATEEPLLKQKMQELVLEYLGNHLFQMNRHQDHRLIQLAIKLLDYPNPQSSKGLVDCTTLLVTLIPDILQNISNEMLLAVNQTLTTKLADDTSHLNFDAIWFRNKMKEMFLKEFERRVCRDDS